MKQVSITTATLRFLALGGLGISILCTMPVSAAEEAPRRLVVTGIGEATARSDMARISAGVIVQGDTANAALAENTRAMTAVLEQLRASAVSEDDVQTSQFTVTPLHERGQPGSDRTEPPRVVGYQVSKEVVVRVRDLEKLGVILDALVSAGANRMNRLFFEVADPKPLLDEARDAAVADALAKAVRYAQAASVELGSIMSIEEGGFQEPRPMLRAAEAMATGAVPIAPGEAEVTASVTVTFAIN